MFNEQNPNPIPDHAYTMVYPETSISKSGDIVILYDAEKARSSFEAWVAGIPFVDDLETKTYLLNEENGEYELQPDFDEAWLNSNYVHLSWPLVFLICLKQDF